MTLLQSLYFSDFGYRILAIGEAFITYAFPFLLTIVMDIAVLYQLANSRQSPKTPISSLIVYQLGFNLEVTNMHDLKSDDVELGLQKFKASNERTIHRFHRLLLQILSQKSLKITEELDLHGSIV
ncbi:hypothetical protein GCK72_015372 [Caenorhabditis remanei]|uniref:Uncharacterized protein n=1 Tax=Caenorhabditis remanei TaxID=31234 RepID=A0A6A5GX34_CAERE|nr:hypothetical protein GCK72_015372 [Caenorhabditis remanei]KAF1758912.1 hypothetical protein GCK72_015372 [Caenorhabditis remanei]